MWMHLKNQENLTLPYYLTYYWSNTNTRCESCFRNPLATCQGKVSRCRYIFPLFPNLALVVGYPISDFLKNDKRKTSVPTLASMHSLWTHACITQVFSLDEIGTFNCFARVSRIITLPFSNSKMLHSNFKGTCTDSFWINLQIMGWRCWSLRYVSTFSQILCPPLYVCVGAWDAGIFVSI
jgi:hypothetical protein